jgi:hypothetical protein
MIIFKTYRLKWVLFSSLCYHLPFIFYDSATLFGFAFLFGSPILEIFGLYYLKVYKKDFIFFSPKQIKKFKASKIVCIVSLCVSLLTIILGILLFVVVSALH